MVAVGAAGTILGAAAALLSKLRLARRRIGLNMGV
jgi:hypothetical protein